MKKTFRICMKGILIASLVMCGSVMGSDLDISGFFDVTSTNQNSQDDKNEFGLGQAELDIESELSPKANVAVAITYNDAEGAFELRAAELGFNLYSSENSSVTSLDIAAGQFDVPFGIDYNWYPSIERKLVTSPMVVDMTHGGWNDFGAKLNVTSNAANLVVFAVNGFESSFEVSDAAQGLALGLNVGDQVNTTPAHAFGGRLGLTPVSDLEIGGSVAMGINQSSKDEMVLVGGDIQYSINQVDFKGEYITHSLNRSIEQEDNTGYYFQSTYNIDPVFLIGRYGAFEPDGQDWVKRYTFGAGYIIAENIQVRFESTINDNSDNNTNILQLAAGF
ncbi:MAG: hypothetical protein U9R56_05620 [candidate division Zixibacteria bacterium]|nr:hypothetical protein [candidate division Zixibacteria bacterium]